LIYKDSLGTPRFLHASSKAKQVILDTTISAYLKQNTIRHWYNNFAC